MKFIANHLYHVYNQGNNREKIFQHEDDYLLFLKKFRQYVSPNCHVLAYCLMPNHFHFMIETTNWSVVKMPLGRIEITKVSNGFRKLLSEYAKEYNEKYGRTGALFRPKTKAKNLTESKDSNYPFICFHYIHQNPMQAKIVEKMENWRFSSFQDYIGLRKGTLCKQEIAYRYIDIYADTFYQDSYKVIDEASINGLFDNELPF